MIAVTVTMTVFPSKRQELLLTLAELTHVMRQDYGFLDARVEMHSGDALTFVEEWDSQDAVNAYLTSEHFHVLSGAMQLLTASSEVTFCPAQEAHQMPHTHSGNV